MSEWKFRMAKYHARQGYAKSQFVLGRFYDNIDGALKKGDPVRAVEWYRKAAEQGLAKAQHNLAVCYLYGEGVPEDRDEAIKWLEKAVCGGSRKAREMLAELKPDSPSLIDAIENAVNTGGSIDALNDEDDDSYDERSRRNKIAEWCRKYPERTIGVIEDPSIPFMLMHWEDEEDKEDK